MKTTKILSRAFAMLAVLVLMVSMLTVPAMASVTDQQIGGTLIQAESTTNGTTTNKGVTEDDVLTHKVLQKFVGTSSKIEFSTSETDKCKQQYTLTGDGQTITVYLSAELDAATLGTVVFENKNWQLMPGDADDSVWNTLFSKGKGIIAGLTGVGTIVMIILFIIQFMKLGSSAGNPQARQQALTGVLWTGVAAALLGSVTIIVGFFYNIL